ERAVVALVEIEARLLPAGDVDVIRDAVLEDANVRRRLPEERAVARREAFERAHLDIRAFVNGLCAGGGGERLGPQVAPLLRARGEDLHDDRVGVAVGDEAGN